MCTFLPVEEHVDVKTMLKIREKIESQKKGTCIKINGYFSLFLKQKQNKHVLNKL